MIVIILDFVFSKLSGSFFVISLKYFRHIKLFFYYQSEIFDIKGLGQLAFGIFTLCYAWSKLAIGFSVLMLIKMVIYPSPAL